MSRSAAERSSGARVAVVGASTAEGVLLREVLARQGVPGQRVDLYGTTRGEVVLSEYDGEARLVQQPEPEDVSRHDVIFLCETGDLARRLAAGASAGAVVVDLVGSLDDAVRPPTVHMDLNPERAGDGTRRLAVPHALTIPLLDVLAPLEAALGVAEAVGVVVRPAGDFGEAGVEELREQTVRLLNFASVPVDTFGRQLAFNVVPHSVVACATPGLERRLAHELAELLVWDEPRASLSVLVAPIFYGHLVDLHLRFRRPADAASVKKVLVAAGLVAADDSHAVASTMDVSGERATRVQDIRDDGLGGFWVRAVAGESAVRSVENAVRLADAVRSL